MLFRHIPEKASRTACRVLRNLLISCASPRDMSIEYMNYSRKSSGISAKERKRLRNNAQLFRALRSKVHHFYHIKAIPVVFSPLFFPRFIILHKNQGKTFTAILASPLPFPQNNRTTPSFGLHRKKGLILPLCKRTLFQFISR